MTAPGDALPYRHRPCARCPYRVDLVGVVAFPNLAAYAAGTHVEADGTGPPVGGMLFACHREGTDPSMLCAGWLAVEGNAHPSIRLAVSMGLIPADALAPSDGWPELFPTTVDMIGVQGYDLRAELDRPGPA